MSTSEEIPLSVASKEAEAGQQPEIAESLEQDDTADTTQDNSKGKAPTVTVGRWKKLFIAVMSLIAFALLTTGISMITPFYTIVVSCTRRPFHHACGLEWEGEWGGGGRGGMKYRKGRTAVLRPDRV